MEASSFFCSPSEYTKSFRFYSFSVYIFISFRFSHFRKNFVTIFRRIHTPGQSKLPVLRFPPLPGCNFTHRLLHPCRKDMSDRCCSRSDSFVTYIRHMAYKVRHDIFCKKKGQGLAWWRSRRPAVLLPHPSTLPPKHSHHRICTN